MNNTAKELLKVDNIEVEYRTSRAVVHAVNGLSFTVHEGETLGLVGETGAGKTTTALSVMRLLPERVGCVTGGSIRFDGEDILSISESAMRDIRGERISMIFQDPMSALNPVITVGKQIAESLMLHNQTGRSRIQIEERVEEILELVGIPAWRKAEYPHQFSGGMKQRIVIAIAIACEPKLLIADEPTTALDVTIQAQVLKMIGELKERLNTSLILITHDLGIVAQICDSVAVMYAGQVVEYSSVEALFSPGMHHPYTKGLFGSIANPLDEKRRLTPIEGLVPDPTKLEKGCKFAPRCPSCSAQCRQSEPGVYSSGESRIKCFLAKED